MSPSDPLTIIARIRQFGLAPDGSDLRDLEAAFYRLTATTLSGASPSPAYPYPPLPAPPAQEDR